MGVGFGFGCDCYLAGIPVGIGIFFGFLAFAVFWFGLPFVVLVVPWDSHWGLFSEPAFGFRSSGIFGFWVWELL